MLRRLIYHTFWNFYDHLGLYVLCGIIHGLCSLGLAILALDSSLTGYMTVWTTLLALCVPLIIALSALLPFSARVARDEPVRWADLWQGAGKHLFKLTITCVALIVAMMILFINLRFYLVMQTKSNPYVFTILAALDGWLLLLIGFSFWPLVCAITSPDIGKGLRSILYKTLVWIVLTPLMWIVVGMAGILLLWAAIASRVGLLFYLPIMVVLVQTAGFLSAQFVELLAQARDESDSGANIYQLKRHAREMALEWENAQHRRTFKELIKPWEY